MPSLFPYFNSMDIIGLPNWQGYCRLQIKNQAVAPFSFENIMDITPYDKKVARKVRDLSRQIYGCSIQDIQKKIRYRRNIWKKRDECGE
jgi:retron-type reverse transcriptase